jgi:hypothetical protein
MAQSIIEEIYDEIKKINARTDATAIPHSDEFIKMTSSMLGVSPDLVKKIMQILVRSHRVFSIEIVLEDQLRETPGVDGYVVADLNILRRLKNVYQRELMYIYNRQNNKNLLVHQIIKEIFPVIKSFNNTPLGENANKAIMLAELENLMEKNFNEYTEDFKENQFRVEISQANLEKLIEKREKPPEKAAAVRQEKARAAPQALRAVDSKTYGDFISKKNKYPLSRIINIYGIDFFYKVNLRNYQFAYLKQVINDRQILKRMDLTHLRDMLRVVRSNVSRDAKLKEYLDDIYDLEKAVVHQLYFSGKEGQP